jgi:hypothetical protein
VLLSKVSFAPDVQCMLAGAARWCSLLVQLAGAACLWGGSAVTDGVARRARHRAPLDATACDSAGERHARLFILLRFHLGSSSLLLLTLGSRLGHACLFISVNLALLASVSCRPGGRSSGVQPLSKGACMSAGPRAGPAAPGGRLDGAHAGLRGRGPPAPARRLSGTPRRAPAARPSAAPPRAAPPARWQPPRT